MAAIENATETEPFGTYAPNGALRALLRVTRALPETWAGRRVALMLRQLVIRALRGRPVDIEVLGAKMRLHPYKNICEKKVLFTPQYFEAEELDILASHIHDRFVFIDIGANVGAYSLFAAAKAGRGARILAVEPQPDVFERLVGNIRFNASGSIKAVDCALADRPGELTLFLDAKNSGESSVKIVGSGAQRVVKVPAKTLLELVREEGYGAIDAIKLDVEGAEDIILDPFLRDAPEALHPKLLIIEDGSERWQMNLPRLVEQKGYRLRVKTRLNFVYEKLV